MSEYRAVWPIADDTYLTRELQVEALPDLYDMLETAGLCQNGPIVWTRTGTDLIAELPVIPEDSPIGDARPWASRWANAAELFDQVAA